MRSRTFAAGALVAIVIAMALAGRLDADEQQRIEMRYCENVVTWRVQASQGIDPLRRHGHPDYKQIAAQSCPGLRPAK